MQNKLGMLVISQKMKSHDNIILSSHIMPRIQNKQNRRARRANKTPLSQTSVSKRDYLDEDPIIPSQRFCALSMSLPTTNMIEEVVSTIAQNNQVNQQMVHRLINDWEDLIRNRRAYKVRGSYEDMDTTKKRIEEIQDFDGIHHVFVGEVGKWLKFGEQADNIADQEWQSTELNSLMKGHAEQKIKSAKHFEERRRRMMESAMISSDDEDDEGAVSSETLSQLVNLDARIEALKFELAEAEASFAVLRDKYPAYERNPEFQNYETNPLSSRDSTRM